MVVQIKETKTKHDPKCQAPYFKGVYVRSSGFNIFSNGKPFVVVKSSKKRKINFRINGKYFDFEKLPIVISQKEAMKLLTDWKEIQEYVIKESLIQKFEHIREDNGEEKKSYTSEYQAKTVLFAWRHKKPEGKFELYKCSVCNELHIGKTNLQ